MERKINDTEIENRFVEAKMIEDKMCDIKLEDMVWGTRIGAAVDRFAAEAKAMNYSCKKEVIDSPNLLVRAFGYMGITSYLCIEAIIFPFAIPCIMYNTTYSSDKKGYVISNPNGSEPTTICHSTIQKSEKYIDLIHKVQELEMEISNEEQK